MYTTTVIEMLVVQHSNGIGIASTRMGKIKHFDLIVGPKNFNGANGFKSVRQRTQFPRG